MNKSYWLVIKMNKHGQLAKQKSSPQLTLKRLNLPPTPKNVLDETDIYSPRRYNDSLFNSGSSAKALPNTSPLRKFYSFKKIRELKVREQNDQGKVIKHVRLQSTHDQHLLIKQRISDLNDIRTISSKCSPRSSNNSNCASILESQIICKGEEVFENNKFQKRFEFRNFGFRRKSNLTKVYHQELDLVIANDLGWLCHYEVTNFPIQANLLALFKNLCHENLLSLYAQHQLSNSKYLLIYEPYQVEFEKQIRRNDTICFDEILKYLIHVVSQLRVFRDRGCYPFFDLQSIVISADQVKLKVHKTRMYGSESELLKDLGSVGIEILNIIAGKQINTTRSKGVKARFQNLMQDFKSGYENSLEDAFVRLSVLKDL